MQPAESVVATMGDGYHRQRPDAGAFDDYSGTGVHSWQQLLAGLFRSISARSLRHLTMRVRARDAGGSCTTANASSARARSRRVALSARIMEHALLRPPASGRQNAPA